MDLKNQLLIGFGVMVLFSIFLGSSTRRGTSSVLSFFWGDNRMKMREGVHLLLSSPFSMNGILYQTWLGYSIGYAAIVIQVIWCLSYILMALCAQRIADLSRTGTLHGSIGRVFGLRAEQAAAVASIIGFTLQIGWELIVGVSIFSVIAPGNTNILTILILTLAGISAIYTILGGIRGNALANQMQNWVGGLALWAVVIALAAFYHSDTTAVPPGAGRPFDGGSFARLITELGIGGFITNAVFSLAWQFVDMSTWQNMAATEKREDAPRKVLFWTALLVFIFPGVVGTAAGMYMRTVPNLTSDNIIPHIIGVVSNRPWLGVFVAAGFVGRYAFDRGWSTARRRSSGNLGPHATPKHPQGACSPGS